MSAKRPTTDQFRIAEALSPLVGSYVDPFDVNVYPARGAWTHTRMDVQRWTGNLEVNGCHYSLGSWNLTLSDLRRGRPFTVHDGRGERWADNSFQFEPVERATQPKGSDHG